MRILVIGGSSFVGRYFAQSAVDRGHDLTLFNRGRTDPGAFPDVEHIIGDREGDLAPLTGRSWDATVDVCGYTPSQVRHLLTTLGDRTGHYTFISSIAVYDVRQLSDGYTEDAPLLAPAWDEHMEPEKYGELKVGCELAARKIAGRRLLIVRPGFVIGPHDPTHRFTYWVERVAEGRSPMAGPDAAQPLQGIDARDLGAFTVAQVEVGTIDTFHVTAPEPAKPFSQWLQDIATGLGKPLPEMRWVGPQASLPSTIPRNEYALMRAGLGRALKAGLTWRPITDTVRDTFDWVTGARAQGKYTPRPGVGATAEQESELLS